MRAVKISAKDNLAYFEQSELKTRHFTKTCHSLLLLLELMEEVHQDFVRYMHEILDRYHISKKKFSTS